MAAEHLQAFCSMAKELGSLSKATTDAMGMAPADSAKDLQALSDKVSALKTDAIAATQTDIDAIVAGLGRQMMVEEDKAAGTSPDQAMAAVDAQQAAATAAAGRFVDTVHMSCGVDVS
jgi:hypothetical protein